MLVQTGDVLDRGPDSERRSTCCAGWKARHSVPVGGSTRCLEPRADAAGVRLALRQPGETNAFKNAESADLREAR